MFRALALALALAFSAPALAQETLPPDPENTVVLETTKGRVVIRLRNDVAPKHAERIKLLTREGFYDSVKFHRVLADFMAQTGDRKYGTGIGGSDYPDLDQEFSKVPFTRGVVGMARSSDPNSANSQFFIMFADKPHLNGKYTVIGYVTEGMDVVDQLKKGEEFRNGAVADPDKIVKMTVQADGK
jgi:peptidylprolyl isomerase